jgi:hypothetical protein
MIYPLPREVTESDYSCFVYFNSADVVSNFVAYVVTSDITQETTHELLQETKALLQDVDGKINQILTLVSVPVPMVAMSSAPVESSDFSGEFWQLVGGDLQHGQTISFALDCPAFSLYAIECESVDDGLNPVAIRVENREELVEEFEFTAGEILGTLLIDGFFTGQSLTVKVFTETAITGLFIYVKPIFLTRFITPS